MGRAGARARCLRGPAPTVRRLVLKAAHPWKRTRNTTRFRRRLILRLHGVDVRLQPAAVFPCEFCLRTFWWRHLTSEHVLPLAAGGEDRITNAVLSCGECNATRDRHWRGCSRCALGDPCLRALRFHLAVNQRCIMKCLLSPGRLPKLRKLRPRYFSLRKWLDRMTAPPVGRGGAG